MIEADGVRGTSFSLLLRAARNQYARLAEATCAFTHKVLVAVRSRRPAMPSSSHRLLPHAAARNSTQCAPARRCVRAPFGARTHQPCLPLGSEINFPQPIITDCLWLEAEPGREAAKRRLLSRFRLATASHRTTLRIVEDMSWEPGEKDRIYTFENIDAWPIYRLLVTKQNAGGVIAREPHCIMLAQDGERCQRRISRHGEANAFPALSCRPKSPKWSPKSGSPFRSFPVNGSLMVRRRGSRDEPTVPVTVRGLFARRRFAAGAARHLLTGRDGNPRR